MFLRCTGGNAGVLGVLQEDAIRNITGNYKLRPYKGRASAQNATLAISFSGVFYKTDGNTEAGEGPQGVAISHYTEQINFDISRVVPTAEENRPLNYSVNICIIFE